MRTHLIVPDTQCKDGQDFEYLTRIGRYIVEVQPDVVIHLGDFADMPSLSSYDVGKKSFEGRRYTKDIDAANKAMSCLLNPLYSYNATAKVQKKKQYNPRKVMLLGNHDNRINRAINDDPKLEGLISTNDLPYQDWEVHDFLKPVFIDGIAYSHYFPTGFLDALLPQLVLWFLSCICLVLLVINKENKWPMANDQTDLLLPVLLPVLVMNMMKTI